MRPAQRAYKAVDPGREDDSSRLAAAIPLPWRSRYTLSAHDPPRARHRRVARLRRVPRRRRTVELLEETRMDFEHNRRVVVAELAGDEGQRSAFKTFSVDGPAATDLTGRDNVSLQVK